MSNVNTPTRVHGNYLQMLRIMNAQRMGVELHELCNRCQGNKTLPGRRRFRGFEYNACDHCNASGLRPPRTYSY
jgi:hypothetical protein